MARTPSDGQDGTKVRAGDFGPTSHLFPLIDQGNQSPESIGDSPQVTLLPANPCSSHLYPIKPFITSVLFQSLQYKTEVEKKNEAVPSPALSPHPPTLHANKDWENMALSEGALCKLVKWTEVVSQNERFR